MESSLVMFSSSPQQLSYQSWRPRPRHVRGFKQSLPSSARRGVAAANEIKGQRAREIEMHRTRVR